MEYRIGKVSGKLICHWVFGSSSMLRCTHAYPATMCNGDHHDTDEGAGQLKLRPINMFGVLLMKIQRAKVTALLF